MQEPYRIRGVKNEASNGMDLNIKEEHIEIKEEPLDVEQEVEESRGIARRGEKRALPSSLSPDSAPEAKKQQLQVEPSTFYSGARTRLRAQTEENTQTRFLIPPTCADSDMEVEVDALDDAFDCEPDPDFLLNLPDDLTPTTSGAATTVRPQLMPEEDTIDSEDEEETTGTAPKRARRAQKDEPERTWKKEDISYPPLPDFTHHAPDALRSPFEYFQDMFPTALLEDIVYQSNLYARQKNVNTTFQIDMHELMVFIGILLYMGMSLLPAVEDYWGTYTRVVQVAEIMSSKRFRLIRSLLHFNNNANLPGSDDRFFKVRPIFAFLTRQFLQVKATPNQSIDEVIVAYKGTKAGTLRQYIQTKPDKWGYKLFCRASSDGFIHDILMYQGDPTFISHHTMLSQEESQLNVSTKTVLVLAKTLKKPSQSTIYADNYFTSIKLVEYLKDKMGCRYVGMARVNRIGSAPLMSNKEMDKKTTPRGHYDYCSSKGILALRWKDNKNVTVLSSDVGVEPVGNVKRYDQNKKKRVEVPCPNVIKQYNGKMGGIDKSDMLTHLYKTPMRARRWYMRLFAYALDLCVCNAWILYKRDCQAMREDPMPLKQFRLDISCFARCQKTLGSRITRASPDQPMPIPRPGYRAQLPTDQQRYDTSKQHLPIFVNNRQTCKHCSTKATIHRSRWMCSVCQIALCLSDTRNCFMPFHIPPFEAEQKPSTSAASP